jgi:predicted TIM-barrel fold metal-dependent hydrolase
MQKFEKDKVELLKALREIVTENLNYADVRAMIDSDVAEFIMELQEPRRQRKLKKIRKALDTLIKETVREEKLRKDERQVNEAKLKQINEAYAAHCNATQ